MQPLTTITTHQHSVRITIAKHRDRCDKQWPSCATAIQHKDKARQCPSTCHQVSLHLKTTGSTVPKHPPYDIKTRLDSAIAPAIKCHFKSQARQCRNTRHTTLRHGSTVPKHPPSSVISIQRLDSAETPAKTKKFQLYNQADSTRSALNMVFNIPPQSGGHANSIIMFIDQKVNYN
jgi:hypothetical protein